MPPHQLFHRARGGSINASYGSRPANEEAPKYDLAQNKGLIQDTDKVRRHARRLVADRILKTNYI